MSRSREAFHGRQSRLVRWQQTWALSAPKVETVVRDPFYIVPLQKVDREVFESIANIFHSVFQGSKIEEDLDYNSFAKSVNPQGIGFIERSPYGKGKALFAATMIRGRDDKSYVRFKAFSNGGSATDADKEDRKRDQFRKKVDEFLLQEKLAVRLSDTH